jgi:hypothetical protein
MSSQHFYLVRLGAERHVEAWSGYPLQFEGQRQFSWQDQMAADLKAALAQLAIAPGEPLAGVYMSSDKARCDVENRLFTNPGTSNFPRGLTTIRFERGIGPPPELQEPITYVNGHLYYYRYCAGGAWESWEPGDVLARWRRVPRCLAEDGSARPAWLTIKHAAATGQIDVAPVTIDDTTPFGIRVVLHATARGPRSALAISENLVDGIVAAFHAPPTDSATVAAALGRRIMSASLRELEGLVAHECGPFFATSPFVIHGPYVQISPCDERCHAGEIQIRPDGRSRLGEISGELFTVRPRMRYGV